MISILIIFLFSIVKANIQTNKTKAYNDSLKVKIERNLQIENSTDLEAGTDNLFIFHISIINYTFYDQEMNAYIESDPQLIEEITLLFTLYIDKYDDSLGYWTSKEIDVRAYDYYETGIYSAYVEDLTLNDLSGDIHLTILDIKVESNETNYIYYIGPNETTFHFTVATGTDIETMETDSDIDSSDNIIISGGGSTSSGLSTGALIGIIIASVAVLVGGIIIVYCCYKKCNKKPSPPEPDDNSSISTNKTNTTMNTESNQNEILFCFEQQNQKKTFIQTSINKSVKEIREKYLIEINRTDLMNDKSIFFQVNGNVITLESEGKLKNFLPKDIEKNQTNQTVVIIVTDTNDAIG